MNKTIKNLLIVLGVIMFIEIQVCLFFCIKTNIDINKNNNQITQQFDEKQDFNNFRGTPPNMNETPNDDISNGAITPGNNSNSRNSKSSNTV